VQALAVPRHHRRYLLTWLAAAAWLPAEAPEALLQAMLLQELQHALFACGLSATGVTHVCVCVCV
jgi:hypothetical protein